jgi:hypothetical protein
MELEEESKYQVKIPLLAGSMRPTATSSPLLRSREKRWKQDGLSLRTARHLLADAAAITARVLSAMHGSGDMLCRICHATRASKHSSRLQALLFCYKLSLPHVLNFATPMLSPPLTTSPERVIARDTHALHLILSHGSIDMNCLFEYKHDSFRPRAPERRINALPALLDVSESNRNES